MAPDPVLVALIAVTRLLPIVAIAAWIRGAPAVALGGLAALAWLARAAQAMRTRAVGEVVRRRAAEAAAFAIARRAPGRLRGAAHDPTLVRVWRGIAARAELATDRDPTVVGAAIAAPIALAIALAITSPSNVAAAIVAFAIAIVVRIPLARRQRARLRPYEDRVKRLASDLGTGMRALDDLHAHGLARAFAERVSEGAARVQEAEASLVLSSTVATWTPVVVAALVVLAWLAPSLGAPSLDASSLDAPSLDATAGGMRTARDLATLLALAPVGLALARALPARARARAEVEALDALVASPDDLPVPADARPAPSVLAPIALEAITHAPTPDGDAASGAPVLDDATLVWRGARPLALVGPNGSGKSTVLGLMLRLADPGAGRVSIGGVDLRDVEPGPLRARVAYVPQRPLVLEGMTVGEAMRLVAPDASDAVLLDALDEVDLRSRLSARGAPLDVPSSSLSVGEVQRVAIARALARSPELLVLDEPEAALDGGARARLRATLASASARGVRVVLAAQHRDAIPEGATIVELPFARGARVEAP